MLPQRKIKSALKIALEEAKTHILQNINSTREEKEETFSYEPAEESMIDECEINSQLQYEKEKMESPLRMTEEEAEEMSRKIEEIASLNGQIKLLEDKLCKKDKELAELHMKLKNNISEELNYLSPIQRSSVNVFSCLRPGAKFSGVVEDIMDLSKKFTKEDSVLIIAGANNVETIGTKRFLNEVYHCLPVVIIETESDNVVYRWRVGEYLLCIGVAAAEMLTQSPYN
ncbi:hypothetical protein J6590_019994 [Homalodisca vitripennis]|nr:hypothetical protein J6590_019994 [Homalodisca vitripennis]